MKITYTGQFKKDYTKAKRQSKNIGKFKRLIEELVGISKGRSAYYDHKLRGNWEGFRCCHIEPD